MTKVNICTSGLDFDAIASDTSFFPSKFRHLTVRVIHPTDAEHLLQLSSTQQ